MGNIRSHGRMVYNQTNISNKKLFQREHSGVFEKDEAEIARYQKKRRQSVAAESFDPEREDMPGDEVIYPKSDAQRRFLQEAVKSILLFSTLDEENVAKVIDAMFERKTKPGDNVISQGEDGDNFYVIASGRYDIFLETDGTKARIGEYDNKGSFGELALMYNTPRAATIVSRDSGVLWALSRDIFRRIILKNAFKKRQMYEGLLESVSLLKHLSPYERMSVCDALVTKQFKDKELIIKQGDIGREMYFIESGEVRIVIHEEGKDVEVKRLKKSQYFGELALITQNPRAASAYSVGRTKVAVLCIESFERLLGPCVHIMKRNVKDYEKELDKFFKDPKNNSLKRKSVL